MQAQFYLGLEMDDQTGCGLNIWIQIRFKKHYLKLDVLFITKDFLLNSIFL